MRRSCLSPAGVTCINLYIQAHVAHRNSRDCRRRDTPRARWLRKSHAKLEIYPINAASLLTYNTSQQRRLWPPRFRTRAAASNPRVTKMANDGELDLNSLNDDDLVQQMHDDLYDGMKEEIEQSVHILLNRGWAPYDVLTKALVEGMRIVGIDFRDGILFVPEVLLAANSMKAGMFILRPLLAETGAPKVGKMVIGTVKGDIH